MLPRLNTIVSDLKPDHHVEDAMRGAEPAMRMAEPLGQNAVF